MKKAIVFILLSMGTQQINAANDHRFYEWDDSASKRNQAVSPTYFGGPGQSSSDIYQSWLCSDEGREHARREAIEAEKILIEQRLSALPHETQLAFLGALAAKLGTGMSHVLGGMETPPRNDNVAVREIPKSPIPRSTTSPVPVIN